MKTVLFELQFPASGLSDLARSYRYESDEAALEAGRKIASGDYSRQNLATIFDWKTNGRGRSRLLLNTDAEIADALELAVRARTERAAVAVLTGLAGVDVPVASAILTVIAPDRYTIIDFRALEALGQKRTVGTYYSVGRYLIYLQACRHLASEHNLTLRDLDRALWQWSASRTAQRDAGS